MTLLRVLCFLGLHPRRGWVFVGDSWNPDLWVRVCIECEREMPRVVPKNLARSR